MLRYDPERVAALQAQDAADRRAAGHRHQRRSGRARRGGHGPGRPCAVGGGLAPAARRRGGQRRHGHLVGLPSRRIPRVRGWSAQSLDGGARPSSSPATGRHWARRWPSTARAVIDDGDVDDVEDLVEALRGAGADDEAVRAFFEELGGAGVADLLMALGTQAGHGAEAAGAGRPGAHPAGRGQSPARLPADVRRGDGRAVRRRARRRHAEPGRRPVVPVRRHHVRQRPARRHGHRRGRRGAGRRRRRAAGRGLALVAEPGALGALPGARRRVRARRHVGAAPRQRPDVRAARVARRRRRRRAGCVHRRAAGRVPAGSTRRRRRRDASPRRRRRAGRRRSGRGRRRRPRAARGRRAGRLGVRRPRRIAERRRAPGLLGQRRGEPVGGHHPRPARAGRPDHRPDRRPGHARTAPRAPVGGARRRPGRGPG